MMHRTHTTTFPARARSLVAGGRLVVAGLAGLLLVTALVVAPASTAPAAAATSVELTTAEAEHLGLVNEHRRRHGLAALVVDARAQADARSWARHLGDTGIVAHDPGLRADCEAASPTCSAWAENVGSAVSHQRVFELFVSSSGHERNLRLSSGSGEHPYRVGIGVHRANGRTYVVHRFIRCDCRNDTLAGWMNQARRTDLAFAEALFADFLGRSATTAELDHAVVAPLAYGIGRRDAVVGLAYSDAWVGALVDRYYRATLGRPADDAGRRFWVDAIRSGRTPAEVAAAFFASDEYFSRTGGTARDWVRALYDELLGRSADDAGLDHWVGVLRWRARTEVAAEFHQSAESRRRRVRELFAHLLDRAPDRDGLAHWTRELADGNDVRLAVELASADEYVTRAVQRFG